jgi:hypothetical protein
MKSKMLENACNLLNKEFEIYYQGRKYISIIVKSKYKLQLPSDYKYILYFNVQGTKQIHQYRFLEATNLGEISGYLQALANIINFGGEFGMTQVENLLQGSLQHLKGNK